MKRVSKKCFFTVNSNTGSLQAVSEQTKGNCSSNVGNEVCGRPCHGMLMLNFHQFKRWLNKFIELHWSTIELHWRLWNTKISFVAWEAPVANRCRLGQCLAVVTCLIVPVLFPRCPLSGMG